MTARRTLARLHVWLAWIVGVPILFWTASGLWMVARPIDEVRGTALRAPPAPLALREALVPPRGARSLALEMQNGRPVWLLTRANGSAARADVGSGRVLPGVTQAEAGTIATASRVMPPAVVGATLTPASAPPVDLRRPRPAWGVAFADGVRVYVDADSGAVLALRSDQWRAFDWMWGLHIMDLGGREDTSHAILIGAAVLALIVTLLGLVLLPLSGRRRR